MKILINDIMQYSDDAPDEIKSPALSDYYSDADNFTVTFDEEQSVNCIGIGYTDATEVYIATDEYTEITIEITQDAPYHNGLYLLGQTLVSDTFTISHNGNYIGRVGLGTYRQLGCNPTMEFGFATTTESGETLSGQVIPGAGGFSRRVFDADVRYDIDKDIVYADILAAYPSQISKSFPYFLLLDDEQHKLPATMLHFYAATNKPLSKLQSSVYRGLWSYKFQFEECF